MELVHFLFWSYTIWVLPVVSYKSDSLKGLSFESDSIAYHIFDDQQDSIKINTVRDQHGDTFWYRHVDTEVCLTGECKRIDVGIYWELSGDFKGLEVYKEPLTKTDHSDFKPWDYAKLMSILENDWSILREYTMEELTDNGTDEVDGKTGATKKEISEESVENAVYTTFTLWHLIHQGEKEQLAIHASKLLNQSALQTRIIGSDDRKKQQLLLEQYALGNIASTRKVELLILKSLSTNSDITLYQTALKALAKTAITDFEFQNEIGKLYAKSSINQKVGLLSSFQPGHPLSPEFYALISKDLSAENEWLAIKILTLFKYSKTQSDYVLETLQQLKKSSNPAVLEAVNALSK